MTLELWAIVLCNQLWKGNVWNEIDNKESEDLQNEKEKIKEDRVWLSPGQTSPK